MGAERPSSLLFGRPSAFGVIFVWHSASRSVCLLVNLGPSLNVTFLMKRSVIHPS